MEMLGRFLSFRRNIWQDVMASACVHTASSARLLEVLQYIHFPSNWQVVMKVNVW
jgi:hypothetical protein